MEKIDQISKEFRDRYFKKIKTKIDRYDRYSSILFIGKCISFILILKFGFIALIPAMILHRMESYYDQQIKCLIEQLMDIKTSYIDAIVEDIESINKEMKKEGKQCIPAYLDMYYESRLVEFIPYRNS